VMPNLMPNSHTSAYILGTIAGASYGEHRALSLVFIFGTVVMIEFLAWQERKRKKGGLDG